MVTSTEVPVDDLLDLLRDSALTEEQLREIVAGRLEAAVFAILLLSQLLAERAIRPAVIIRKKSYGNRSEQGADYQAVLMSIFRTLKQRGHDPIRTIVAALATYPTTGQLPPLPETITTSDGRSVAGICARLPYEGRKRNRPHDWGYRQSPLRTKPAQK